MLKYYYKSSINELTAWDINEMHVNTQAVLIAKQLKKLQLTLRTHMSLSFNIIERFQS